MSRIGRLPITVPSNVDVTIDGERSIHDQHMQIERKRKQGGDQFG